MTHKLLAQLAEVDASTTAMVEAKARLESAIDGLELAKVWPYGDSDIYIDGDEPETLWLDDRLAADGKLRRHKPSSKRNGRVLFSAAQVNRLITSSKTR